MYSADELKLLGFVFNKNPNVHSQIDSLVSKAASRSFVVRHLASETANKNKLKNVYCALVSVVLSTLLLLFLSVTRAILALLCFLFLIQ